MTENGISNEYISERLVRLVSVGLKEATMDSPSFRASTNFMHISIIQCSRQIQKSLSVLQRYSAIWSSFIDVSNEMEGMFIPYTRNDTHFISNDISKPCLTKFLKGNRIILDSALSLFQISEAPFQAMKDLIEVDIQQYLELRKNFERIQNKYDIISAKFMQLPKGYDPQKTRDDALQLFEIRKQYIQVSMLLWISVKQLELKICRVSTEVPGSFWSTFSNTNTDSGAKLAEEIGLADIAESIKQLNMCAELQNESSNSLLADLNRTRINSEEGAIKMFAVSTNLQDFDPSPFTNQNLLDTDTSVLEKHGWVFIKSPKLTGGKGDIWIKRWMFIKDGVFGFLSISQDGQYVQESDKIGVLLVSVKYYPDEDRKFCFRISSQQTNLTIQVETSQELRSWLTVFRNSTLYSVETKSVSAAHRYSPPLNMLKLVPVVAKDLEIIDVSPVDPQTEKTSKLIELQLSNLKFSLSINPPIKTRMTEKLVMAHLYLSPTIVPSATTANFWGYVNWGLYFLLDDEQRAKISDQSKSGIPKSIVNLRYDNYYPESLRVADAELRSIFEVFVQPQELTLLKFNCSWSPNAGQNLFCSVYVTNQNFYVYGHTSGLISILPLSLSSFLEVDVIERNDDKKILKAYFVNGMALKMQLYDDDLHAVKSKFNYIITALREKTSVEDIVSNIIKIEQSYLLLQQKKHRLLVDARTHHEHGHDIEKLPGVVAQPPISGISQMEESHIINYTPQMHRVLSRKYNIPAKALFHMLFGDESSLLQCTLPLASSQIAQDKTRHGLWRCDSTQKLTRVVWNSVCKLPCALQTVENMTNNKYYNVLQETPYLRFVFGINKKVYTRFVIYSIDSKTSKLLVYYSLSGGKSVLNWFSQAVLRQIMNFRILTLEENINNGLKSIDHGHKKIAHAIQSYGPITKYDSDEPTKDEIAFKNTINFLPVQLYTTFFYEKLNSEVEKSVAKAFHTIWGVLSRIFVFCNANMMILLILAFSIIINLFMMGKTSSSYWRERHINKHVKTLVSDHYLMERSISLTDIDDLLYPNTTSLSAVNGGSECYWKFLQHENLLDLSKYSRIHDLDEDEGKYEARGRVEVVLSKRLTGLRIERNELLTKLNLLNYAEREFIINEWKNWLTSEIANCEKVETLYPETFEALEPYCKSVEIEMINLYKNIL